MNYFIVTAILALAASKTKVQIKNNQSQKEWQDNSDDSKEIDTR